MNDKVAAAQSWVDPILVAKMQMDFINHFRDVYPYDLHMMAVGPMQSFIGLMIEKGYMCVRDNDV